VSDVTIVATFVKRRRPSGAPAAAKHRRSASVNRIRELRRLRRQDAILFTQVPDDLMRLALEPTENGCDEQVQWNHSAESTPPARSGFEHYALVADRPSRAMTDAIGLSLERSGQQLTIPSAHLWWLLGTNATLVGHRRLGTNSTAHLRIRFIVGCSDSA
jgi:hypothetical protein